MIKRDVLFISDTHGGELTNRRFLSGRVRTGSERKATRLGGSCSHSFHRWGLLSHLLTACNKIFGTPVNKLKWYFSNVSASFVGNHGNSSASFELGRKRSQPTRTSLPVRSEWRTTRNVRIEHSRSIPSHHQPSRNVRPPPQSCLSHNAVTQFWCLRQSF